ncbi:MAG: hypothetical protein UW21_C0016G0006 [Candidatus Woesebacteria bacterium GW2011_GWB1_44_11b]|uniref:Uncharacterized protein n=1 Tax=Candidatus Woesebacteria bacterium GW2011_GWB1_44_11b TaxID=1618580 RepID=A0A0G1IMB8_9BACT|nr:MAG: hypothetical protein UW21_C0016G0006 [Candidatus Woesebacteria bacterium GW2011_GWB1_44_11b]
MAERLVKINGLPAQIVGEGNNEELVYYPIELYGSPSSDADFLGRITPGKNGIVKTMENLVNGHREVQVTLTEKDKATGPSFVAWIVETP